MRHFAFLIAFLAFLGVYSQPVREKRAAAGGADVDDVWTVRSFSSSVAPHSISQITAFSLASPALTADRTVTCSNATGAAISATPYLVPVIDGDCAPGSGFNFTFRQLGRDYAVELSVKHAATGRVGTYTSETDSVTTVATGPGPFDTLTAYVGAREFVLGFST